GDGPAAIHKQTDDQQQLAYLDQLTWALPYHLTSPQRVLILGAGGGSEVLQAQYHKVSHIDAVELNPQVTRLISQTYKDYTGGIYNQDRVRLITAEARGFVETTSQHYDLIQVALIDSFSASSAGLFALSENYLYTVEGLQAYLEKLTSDGYLSISRWLKLPPRDSLKLIATAIMSLQQLGIQHPDQHLALIRSWQTSTLIVKRQAFSPQDLENLKSFCQQRGFDVSYYPGIQPEEVNRFNIMADPLPYHAAIALLGSDRDRFLADYKFNLEPATDDRPYFFHFFKWQSLPEIINLFGRGGIPLLDTGYLILVTTLLQAFVISVFLILLPLWFYRRQQQIQLIRAQAGRVFVYFTSLGLAFLFLEIAFIQKLILYLHHPLYAVAVVLTAFLVFAGLGSLVSQHLIHKQASLRWPVTSLILLSLIYLSLLDSIFISMAELEDIFRIAFSILLIAPLAFCMGMPFPVGIHRLEQTQPQLIPWAWGINGCASVISAVLATLLAMHIGFTMVVIIATGLYGIAAFSLPRLE
ncbi:MAG TPA: SAM-dependent methyltransferase, partial [Gammaproteobacteria bacterium]